MMKRKMSMARRTVRMRRSRRNSRTSKIMALMKKRRYMGKGSKRATNRKRRRPERLLGPTCTSRRCDLV